MHRSLPLGRVVLLLSALVAAACSTSPQTAAPPPTSVSGAVRVGRDLQTRGGAVACEDRAAAEVGARLIAAGGNAVDAAVGMAFALAVTWPPAGNLGGGGMALVAGPDVPPATLDFRERAPAAVDAGLFVAADSGRVVSSRADDPWLMVGVPGTPAGLEAVHARHGRLPWRAVLAPAIVLARDGFVVDPTLADWLAFGATAFARIPASAAVFLDGQGDPWRAGDVLVQTDLGLTLEALAEQGAAPFYSGEIARLLCADVTAHGGVLTRADLADYRPVWREPLALDFAGHVVLAPPPPSSGGVALGQILGQLERRPRGPGGSAAHLFVEAARRAFADRARFLGDPDHVDVPVEWLLSDAHLDDLAATIDTWAATPSAALGPPLVSAEGSDTTHLSVVDAEGLAVSMTLTLEEAFGGKAVAAGTGVLLNNQLRDFNRAAGQTTAAGLIGTAPNLAGPGRRPLTSMTPVIVLQEGSPVLVTGSPGGRTIISTVAQVVLRAIGLREDLGNAVAAPRLHHQWYPDEVVVEADHELPSVSQELRSRGHTLRAHSRGDPTRGRQGAAHSVGVDRATGTRRAVADWRRDGWAAVVDR